jgi:hypothetical protein
MSEEKNRPTVKSTIPPFIVDGKVAGRTPPVEKDREWIITVDPDGEVVDQHYR